MKYKKEDGFNCNDLIQYGIDHLISAHELFKKGARFYDSAGYLSHIGIELLLKAICLDKIEYFENNHNLNKIIELLGESFKISKGKKQILERINNFEQLRYPRSNDPIEIGFDDWRSVEMLKNYLLRKIVKETKIKLADISDLEKGGRILLVKKNVL